MSSQFFFPLSSHRLSSSHAAVEPLFRRVGTWRRLAWSNLRVHELSARACPPRRFSRGSTRVDGAALFIEARRLCAASRLLVATGPLIAAGGCRDSGRSSDRSPPGPTTSGTKNLKCWKFFGIVRGGLRRMDNWIDRFGRCGMVTSRSYCVHYNPLVHAQLSNRPKK